MGNIWSKLRLGKRSRRSLLKASTWLRDERGSLNVLYAVALIPMIGALGLATDTARGYLLKARLSQSIDQAVLAGGKVFFEASRDTDVLKYFSANFPNSATISYGTPFQADFMEANVTLSEPVAVDNGNGSSTLSLQASATIPTTFMRVLNAFGCTSCDDITVVAAGQAERTIRAVDTVISLDMSGSMDGAAKIGNAVDGLVDFMDVVYGPTNNTSPQLTVAGVTYNLVNIGFVPWNSKTNVTTQGQTFSSVTTETVTSYTNPITGAAGQTTVWKANNSEVPLLMNPRNTTSGGQLPGGWSGCVYARYVGGEATPGGQDSNTNSVNTNDADLVKGAQFDVGSGTTQKDWPGWEPMAINDAEPRSGSWTSAEAGGSSMRWIANSAWRARSCNLAYYTDFGSGTYTSDTTVLLDQSTGNVKGLSPNTSRPTAVPAATAATSATYSGTMRFFNDNTRPYAVPVISNNPSSTDCTPCLSRSIIPMTPNKLTIQNEIGSITDTDPNGNTNILQGLYWAWEVLMPGEPFNQAYVTTPFARDRYIVLVTDGEQVGGNGDAYKGRFGSGTVAGTNTDSAHGTITVNGSTMNNNLDNRLRQLALNVRNNGIRLYVIGFDLAGNTHALTLLADIASPQEGDRQFFYQADTGADLKAALKEIAESMTQVRLSM